MEFLIVLLLGAIAIGAAISSWFVSKNSNDIRIFRTRERSSADKAVLAVAMWVSPVLTVFGMLLTQRAFPAVIAIVIGLLTVAVYPYILPKDPGPGLPVGRKALMTNAWITIGFAMATVLAGAVYHVWNK